jgi:hypothetical protein
MTRQARTVPEIAYVSDVSCVADQQRSTRNDTLRTSIVERQEAGREARCITVVRKRGSARS